MIKRVLTRLQISLRFVVTKLPGSKRNAPYLSVCAMYRDEAPYLDEWIRFHVSEGVEHFYLYDDESTDEHLEVLDPWIELGTVTVFPAQGRIQEELFKDCLERNKNRGTWMAFIDVDEFLFAPNGESLTHKLADYESNAAVFVFWKIFGTSGLAHSTEQGVIEDFVYALPVPRTYPELVDQHEKWEVSREGTLLTGRPIQGKSVVRISEIFEMGVHFPIKFRGQIVNSAHRRMSTDQLRDLRSNENLLPTYEGLLIHHYWSRSRDSLERKFEKPGASRAMRSHRDRHPKMRHALNWDHHLSGERDLNLVHRVRAREFPYVFVIGFNKTATRALAKFFTENGLPAMHWDWNRLVDTMIKNLSRGERLLSGYDSQYRVFTDFISVSSNEPVEGNAFFREMDHDYPGSYFILNNRDTKDWLQSRLWHNQGEFLDQYMTFLGTNDVGEVLAFWAEQKVTHENAVREYFADSNRFLELDIDSKYVPQQLETFLGIQMDYSSWRVIGKTRP